MFLTSSPLGPLRQTGLLVMGPEHSKGFQMMKTMLLNSKTPTVILTRDNFSQHIPNMVLAERDGAIVEVTAGVLYADRALKTAQVTHQTRREEKLTGQTVFYTVRVLTSTKL